MSSTFLILFCFLTVALSAFQLSTTNGQLRGTNHESSSTLLFSNITAMQRFFNDQLNDTTSALRTGKGLPGANVTFLVDVPFPASGVVLSCRGREEGEGGELARANDTFENVSRFTCDRRGPTREGHLLTLSLVRHNPNRLLAMVLRDAQCNYMTDDLILSHTSLRDAFALVHNASWGGRKTPTPKDESIAKCNPHCFGDTQYRNHSGKHRQVWDFDTEADALNFYEKVVSTNGSRLALLAGGLAVEQPVVVVPIPDPLSAFVLSCHTEEGLRGKPGGGAGYGPFCHNLPFDTNVAFTLTKDTTNGEMEPLLLMEHYYDAWMKHVATKTIVEEKAIVRALSAYQP